MVKKNKILNEKKLEKKIIQKKTKKVSRLFSIPFFVYEPKKVQKISLFNFYYFYTNNTKWLYISFSICSASTALLYSSSGTEV